MNPLKVTARAWAWSHGLILAACGFLVYANTYQNSFHLDDSHVLLDNPYVRSLSHIPRYFVDPLTFTSYRNNVDYRPVLQTTYALNYAWSGYQPWSWHLVQTLLHVWCAIWLYLFVSLAAGPSKDEEPHWLWHAPFIAALIFVLHPTASGVVNYFSARSSLLVAAWLLPSFYAALREADRGRRPWLSTALFALALFTKVEAVAALAVYGLIRLRREKSWRALAALWPYLLLTAVYGIIRKSVVPDFTVAMRQEASMTHWNYLLTETTAWWYYLLHWAAPVNLIADHGTYPLFHSLLQPEVALACVGWAGVGLILWRSHWKGSDAAFFAAAGFALITPHSSFMPLAELVNEHRPYLPVAVASAAWLTPAVDWARGSSRLGPWMRWSHAAVLVLACLALGKATWERNRVFKDEASYWSDVVKKAPSARSTMNYGLTFLSQGRYQEADRYFETALGYAPYWFFAHINRGISLDMLGRREESMRHFARAIELEQNTALGYRYRGMAHARHGEDALAIQDFLAAVPKTTSPCELYAMAADSYRRLGNAAKEAEYRRLCPGP